ncbi:hypothetical protein FACS189429_1330 [Bacteroidia bacterium]|nr:hypothetical protein FACS189429_1330 [Bacteroidia bacterium]
MKSLRKVKVLVIAMFAAFTVAFGSQLSAQNDHTLSLGIGGGLDYGGFGANLDYFPHRNIGVFRGQDAYSKQYNKVSYRPTVDVGLDMQSGRFGIVSVELLVPFRSKSFMTTMLLKTTATSNLKIPCCPLPSVWVSVSY